MRTLELLPPSETMYRALLKRDPSFEGIFFVGVRTTGIFCRPTCTAKKPARENVDFFATPSEALDNGYRPCLRCQPMDPDKRPPKLIERLRTEVDRAPGGRLTDKELAALAIDPSTARRQFKRHYGMTFQAYHRARRMGLALSQVRKGRRVDEARNGSGFESESGFREAFTKIFGEPPTNAKTRAPLLAERIYRPPRDPERIVDFAEAIANKCSAGRTFAPDCDAPATQRLFFRQKPGVRYSISASRVRISTARLGNPALRSGG